MSQPTASNNNNDATVAATTADAGCLAGSFLFAAGILVAAALLVMLILGWQHWAAGRQARRQSPGFRVGMRREARCQQLGRRSGTKAARTVLNVPSWLQTKHLRPIDVGMVLISRVRIDFEDLATKAARNVSVLADLFENIAFEPERRPNDRN